MSTCSVPAINVLYRMLLHITILYYNFPLAYICRSGWSLQWGGAGADGWRTPSEVSGVHCRCPGERIPSNTQEKDNGVQENSNIGERERERERRRERRTSIPLLLFISFFYLLQAENQDSECASPEILAKSIYLAVEYNAKLAEQRRTTRHIMYLHGHTN